MRTTTCPTNSLTPPRSDSRRTHPPPRRPTSIGRSSRDCFPVMPPRRRCPEVRDVSFFSLYCALLMFLCSFRGWINTRLQKVCAFTILVLDLSSRHEGGLPLPGDLRESVPRWCQRGNVPGGTTCVFFHILCITDARVLAFLVLCLEKPEVAESLRAHYRIPQC